LHDPRGDEFPTVNSKEVEKLLEDAEARGELTLETAAQILPNKSWLTLICDHCLDDQEKVVSMGLGFFKRYYCRTCLHNALEEFNK